MVWRRATLLYASRQLTSNSSWCRSRIARSVASTSPGLRNISGPTIASARSCRLAACDFTVCVPRPAPRDREELWVRGGGRCTSDVRRVDARSYSWQHCSRVPTQQTAQMTPARSSTSFCSACQTPGCRRSTLVNNRSEQASGWKCAHHGRERVVYT